MSDRTSRLGAILVLTFLAPLALAFPAFAQFNPGATVNFGQQTVGTAGPEVVVAQVPYFPGATNTIAFSVSGDFRRGASSTCPSIPMTVPIGGCILTVVFTPTQAGTRTGQLVNSIGLCSPVPCPSQTWALTGTGVVAPPPNAPTQLRAEPVSLTQVRLAWSDNSNSENGFHLERSTSSAGPFTQILTTNANITGYLDSNLQPATTYYYRVRAFGVGGSSGYSNVAFTTTSSPGQISDTVPPQLVMFAFSPSVVDVRSGAQLVTVTARVTDNLSGMTAMYVQFRSPSSLQLAPFNPAFLHRLSGTALDGIYQGAITIPSFVEAGLWRVNVVTLSDFVGNTVNLSTFNLTSVGFPTDLTVVSVADTLAPTISHIAFPAPSINVSAGAQPLAIDFTIDDDASGVDFTSDVFLEFRVQLLSPSGGQWQFIAKTGRSSMFTMTSGTTLSGTWRGTATIPRYSEAGIWRIAFIQLIDFAGNRRTYNTTQLQDLGLATQFSVVSVPNDTTRPSVTGLSFSPAVIDTSVANQVVTVTLTITDNLAGVSFAPDTLDVSFAHGIQFVSPSGGQVRIGANSSFSRTAGTPLNGVWTTTVSFPRFSEGGTWKASLLNIKDAANNGVLNGGYSTAQLASMGLPTDLTVFRPSGAVDASIPPTGGTASDDFFGNRASVTFPPASLPRTTDVAIDVLPGVNPLSLPTPAGFTTGTLFVNVALTPTPPMPLPAPGLTVVLPFSAFKPPGSPIVLYRLDPLLGVLIPAVSVSGRPVVGTVNADGLSATFTGVSHLSTLVGFVPLSVLGDVNGDGLVSCSDLAIVRSAFGKRTGQAGFDGRADLNGNGVIDVNDLALVSRQLPVGTACGS